VFGLTITRLLADKISEIVERFLPPQICFKMGQVFWSAVAVDDPPACGKRIENTRLVIFGNHLNYHTCYIIF
jgi:hypothetical protein